jgi:predicted HTH domain antitoxin
MDARVRASDLLLDLALGMYASNRVTLGRAAEIAGLSQLDFQRELGRRRIPLHYDLEDFQADLRAVREICGS